MKREPLGRPRLRSPTYYIPQSYRTGVLPSKSFVSYLGHSLEGGFLVCKDPVSVYSSPSAVWAVSYFSSTNKKIPVSHSKGKNLILNLSKSLRWILINNGEWIVMQGHVAEWIRRLFARCFWVKSCRSCWFNPSDGLD